MKKLISILLCFSLVLSVNIFVHAEKYNPFVDVPEEHYAYEEISYLYIYEIINGKSEKNFEPEANITREELAKVLVASLDKELSDKTGSFIDVTKGSWYEPYVETCKEANIYNGITQNEFGVGKFVTKQDCAVLMHRLSEIKTPVSVDEYSDVLPADFESVSGYAKDAVKNLAHRRVLKFENGENFNPGKYVTRAEVCQMLYGVITQADPHWNLDKWTNYDRTVENDRLSEQMPTPFSPDNYPQSLIASYDFESDDLGDFELGWCFGTWSIEEEGGIDNSRCVKLEQTGEQSHYQLLYKDPTARPGDWYIMTCKIKCVDCTQNGRITPLFQVENSEGKWLNETQGTKANDINLVNGEWVERSAMLNVPREANTLEADDDFYVFRLNGYMLGMDIGCVAYVDDIELKKILFDPMDTALVTPNYKGLIYGNDGVSDINMRVWTSEYNGGYDRTDFLLTSNIVDADGKIYATSQVENVTEVMEVTFSSNLLDVNKDYYLEAILKSKTSGEVLQKQEWTLRVREENYRPYIYFDKYNRMVKDGETVFPLLQYFWSDGIFMYEDMLQLLEDRPVDVMSIGGQFMEEKYRQLRSQSLMKKMNEMGVQGRAGIVGFCYSDMFSGIDKQYDIQSQSDIRKVAELYVDRFKDDPMLFSWYMWDEVNPVLYGEELRWQNDILANADINHPTMGAADDLSESRPGVYSKTCDVIGHDPYVCTGKENQDLGNVYRNVSKLMENTPNKPQNVILQGFWFQARGDLRGPREQEYRNMAWQAVCAGVSMIDNYAITDVTLAEWDNKTYEEIWEEQMKTYEEIRYMTPVILSREPAPAYEIKGGGDWLNTISRKHDGKCYLFAVNNQDETKQFRVNLDGVKKIKGMYTDKEYTADENGWFKIDMDELEVEIFEYEKEDYKSPHAELIRFGVSNKEHSYIVTDFNKENPVINIDDNASNLDFLATVSDYASVYINEVNVGTLENTENVGISGTIDITGLDSIVVKVVSEDGRFTTEKRYLLTRNSVEEK